MSDPKTSRPPAPRFGYRRPIQPIHSLREHRSLAIYILLASLVLGVMLGLALGPLYVSHSLIRVSPLRTAEDLKSPKVQNNTFDAFVESQSYQILRHRTLRKAFEAVSKSHPEIATRFSFAGFSDAMEARRISGTHLIQIQLAHSDPTALEHLVNAVVSSYLDDIREQVLKGQDARAYALNQRKQALQKQLGTALTRKAEVAKKLGLLAGEEKLTNPYARAMAFLSKRLVEARSARVEAAAALAALEETVKNTPKEKIAEQARQQIEVSPEFQEEKKRLAERRVLLKARLLQSESEDDEFLRDAVQAKIKLDLLELVMQQEEHGKARKEAILTAERSLQQALSGRLETARASLRNTMEVKKQLAEELDNYRKQNASYTTLFNQAQDIQTDIDRLRQFLSKLDDQLDSSATESTLPGAVQLEAAATPPKDPRHGHRLWAGLTVLGLGILLALVAACAVDHLNPWVMNPRDVAAILQRGPVGWVLHRSDERSELFARDQMRRLAITLKDWRQNLGRQTIAFTAVKPDAGGTSLCLALANELTDIGIRTVVVEANAFHPDPIYRQTEGNKGLVQVVDKEATLADVLQPAGNGLPARIAVGELGEARHLSQHGEIGEIFADLSKEFDVCLIDAPSILLSADAEALARIVNYTLLVVEAEGNTLNEMARAASNLRGICQDSHGVLLNKAHVYEHSGYFADLIREYESGEKASAKDFFHRYMLKSGRKQP